MDYPKSDPSVGLVNGKFTDGNPAEGVPASLDPSSWANQVTDEMLNVLAQAGIEPDESQSDQLAAAIASTSPMAGSVSKLSATLAHAGASLTVTADQIIVATALSGRSFCIPSFVSTVNLATTGAGGMDTGAAPTSGFVGIYAIYNPTTGVSALLATNATNTAAPTIYGGADMPSGYTASALISVWPTNSSGQMIAAAQVDRQIGFLAIISYTSTSMPSVLTDILFSSELPKNARSAIGFSSITVTSGSGSLQLNLASNTSSANTQSVFLSSSATFNVTTNGYFNIPLVAQQRLSAALGVNGPTGYSVLIYISGYTI